LVVVVKRGGLKEGERGRIKGGMAVAVQDDAGEMDAVESDDLDDSDDDVAGDSFFSSMPCTCLTLSKFSSCSSWADIVLPKAPISSHCT